MYKNNNVMAEKGFQEPTVYRNDNFNRTELNMLKTLHAYISSDSCFYEDDSKK